MEVVKLVASAYHCFLELILVIILISISQAFLIHLWNSYLILLQELWPAAGWSDAGAHLKLGLCLGHAQKLAFHCSSFSGFFVWLEFFLLRRGVQFRHVSWSEQNWRINGWYLILVKQIWECSPPSSTVRTLVVGQDRQMAFSFVISCLGRRNFVLEMRGRIHSSERPYREYLSCSPHGYVLAAENKYFVDSCFFNWLISHAGWVSVI